MEFMNATSNPASGGDSTAANRSLMAKKTPTDFLKQVIGKPVVVKLHSGVVYKGILACLDGFMNIAMEQTEEYVDNQMKNKYGDCFIRGNNGKDISSCIYSYSLRCNDLFHFDSNVH
jgi:U6 snRNA-associated Sm-like protein LSm6